MILEQLPQLKLHHTRTLPPKNPAPLFTPQGLKLFAEGPVGKEVQVFPSKSLCLISLLISKPFNRYI